MAELIYNSRLFWMKTIYLSRSVNPLSLLPGGICDSGRNALTDISRCLPSDDRVHGIPCFDNDDDACSGGRFWVPRPALSGAQVVPSHPYRAAVALLGPDTHRHKSVPARHSDGLSRPGWMVGYRLGYPDNDMTDIWIHTWFRQETWHSLLFASAFFLPSVKSYI